jgi:NADH dehydrogenase
MTTRRPRVVIVGGGFAGLKAARRLRNAPVDVTLLDRTNHYVFQPLLYQVATASLSPSDISVPIRYLVRRQANTEVLLAHVHEIDTARRVVIADDERREYPYDYLILAAGARHSYFGHAEWERLAPGLKSIEDAMAIRRRFLLAYELAEKASSAEERARLLTFVIVGAGPTGVELAGIIPGIARHTLRADFRHIDTAATRVILVEGGDRVLPSFHESLSTHALRDLEELGVEVRLRSLVTAIDEQGVCVGEERIAAGTVLWGAGNAASPLGRSLGVGTDRAGRVAVAPDLSVPGHPELFVVGDLAVYTLPDGAQVPGVAPAANQMGDQAARNIVRDLRGEPRRPFRYADKGDLATIGRYKAVGSFNRGKFRIAGHLAWWLWLSVHILYLTTFRNRLSVFVQWAYGYFTWQRGVRLITGHGAPVDPPATTAPVGVKW